MNLGVLKEPKGFITIPQIIISIIAFSVLASYSDKIELVVDCSSSITDLSTSTTGATSTEEDTTTLLSTTSDDPSDSTTTITTTTTSKSITPTTTPTPKPLVKSTCNMTLEYPFRLEKFNGTCTTCYKNETTLNLTDTCSSKAIFFMFIGVLSFLYALAMIPVYLLQDDIVSKFAFFPTLDLILHGVFFIFWFCGSIAWAAGVANLKYETGEEQVISQNQNNFGCDIDYECELVEPSNYAGPVVSVVFGFINLLLFGGNMWFVFKDTSFSSS